MPRGETLSRLHTPDPPQPLKIGQNQSLQRMNFFERLAENSSTIRNVLLRLVGIGPQQNRLKLLFMWSLKDITYPLCMLSIITPMEERVGLHHEKDFVRTH